MKRTAIVASLFLMVLASTAIAADVVPVVAFTPFSSKTSEVQATGVLQARVLEDGCVVRQWASSMGCFFSGIPTGGNCKNRIVEVFPHPLPGAEKVFATRSDDLPATIDLRDPRLIELPKVPVSNTGVGGGSVYVYSFSPDVFPGPGAVRFYALIKNGKRIELRAFGFIGIVEHSNSQQPIGVFEYTTAPLPDENGKPGPDAYRRIEMNRAGAGGKGGEYEDLAMENWEKAQERAKWEAANTPRQEKPRDSTSACPSFRIRFVDGTDPAGERPARFAKITLWVKHPSWQSPRSYEVVGGSVTISDIPAGDGYTFWYTVPEYGNRPCMEAAELHIGRNTKIKIKEEQ